jgi:hypothetical protein
VDIAVEKARDLVALNNFRQSSRTKLMSSIIGDSRTYAQSVETEYRAFWRKWCAEIHGTL